jgi:Flp pilus assembly protein TadB
VDSCSPLSYRTKHGIAMPTRLSNSTKETIIAAILIAAVVIFLYIFHFLLGMTWMVYVLVIAVLGVMLLRKMTALKRKKGRLNPE